MKPLTNSQLAACKPEAHKAERGIAAEVNLSHGLRRSHTLVRGTGKNHHLAEIRDSATGDAVIASGTYEEMISEAGRRDLL